MRPHIGKDSDPICRTTEIGFDHTMQQLRRKVFEDFPRNNHVIRAAGSDMLSQVRQSKLAILGFWRLGSFFEGTDMAHQVIVVERSWVHQGCIM